MTNPTSPPPSMDHCKSKFTRVFGVTTPGGYIPPRVNLLHIPDHKYLRICSSKCLLKNV